MALVHRTWPVFSKNMALITGPNTAIVATKLRAWQMTLPDTFQNMQILDLDRCNPPIGVQLADASGTVRYFGDARWPALIYEALSDSFTAGTGTCSIFVRVCQSGDAAHVFGYAREGAARTHDGEQPRR